jgi:hypothetical protein
MSTSARPAHRTQAKLDNDDGAFRLPLFPRRHFLQIYPHAVKLETKPEPAPHLRWEPCLAVFLVFCFCLINLLVATRSPTVSVDEPEYCDPAANLHFGSGFTSTLWAQNHDAFWCGNVPLYQGILCCFFNIAGFGLFQARIVNTFLAALAALLICAALRRNEIVKSSMYRLICVCLILSGSVSTLTFRTIRPDTTMFLACSLVFFACSLRGLWQRHFFAFLASALLPFAGVPMLPYAAMLLFLNFIVYGFANLGLLIAVGLGFASGVAGLVIFYNHFSTWHTFVDIVLPFTGIGGAASGSAPSLFQRIFGAGLGGENIFTSFFGNPLEFLDQKTLFDYSAALLFVAAVALAVKSWHAATIPDRKFMTFILVMAVIVPPFMHMAGHYRSMYRWMTYIPLAIALPRFLEIHKAAGGRFSLRFAAILVILFSLCLGLPLRTAAAIPGWRGRSIKPLERVAARVMRPPDVVICEAKSYFALRPGTKLLYGFGFPARGEFRLITDLPTNDVSLLCLRPEDVAPVIQAIGGTWKKLDLRDVPGADALAQTRYAVDFYRRESDPAPSLLKNTSPQ